MLTETDLKANLRLMKTEKRLSKVRASFTTKMEINMKETFMKMRSAQVFIPSQMGPKQKVNGT
jgi:hypothetical protein